MPRAFPNSPHSINKSKDAKVRSLISSAKNEEKINNCQLAEAINVSRNSFTSRMKKPETLTLGELRILREKLNWGPEILDSII